ncbi:MAG: extracellular solute-binding protein [Pseudomonadota bacterium]
MKRILMGMLSLSCFLSLCFFVSAPKVMASAKAGWEGKWGELVEAAKKEGKVMIYGFADPDLRKDLRKAFSEKYGIEPEFLSIPQGGELTARMKKERAAGLYLADVLFIGPTTMTFQLKPAGILDTMEPLLILPEVTDPKVWRKDYIFTDKEGMIRPLRALFSRFAFRNSNLVKESELTSYRDLLDPKWKGKMVLCDPTIPGSGNAFVAFLNGTWGRDQTVEFLKQLVKQEPVVTNDIRLPMEWVARGKSLLAIAPRPEALPEFLKAGAPIATVKMIEGGLLTPGSGCIAVVNNRPHPNAAAVFINWVLSKEGLTVWSKADGFASARLDVPTDWVPAPFVPEAGERLFVEDEEAYKVRSELMNLCKEIFGPLMK